MKSYDNWWKGTQNLQSKLEIELKIEILIKSYDNLWKETQKVTIKLGIELKIQIPWQNSKTLGKFVQRELMIHKTQLGEVISGFKTYKKTANSHFPKVPHKNQNNNK